MTQDTDTCANEATATAPARRTKWRVLRVLAAVLAVPGGLAVLGFLALLGRDIAAPDWVVAQIEDRASATLGGGSLTVADVSFNLGYDLHPRVMLTGTELRDAEGSALARIPLIEGLFSPRGVLFQRDALMQDLRITGAQINLRRAPDGSVALSFQTGGADVEQAPSLLELLDQSDRIFDRPALAALETIRAEGLIINYADARAGRAWTVDGGALTLDVRDATTTLAGTFAVLSGGADITTLDLEYVSPRDTQAATIAIDIQDALAADIAAQSPALSWLAGIDAPVSAQLRSARHADGTIAPLDARLTLGAGALQPNAATKPIAFEGAAAELSFNPARNLIDFHQLSVNGDLGRVQARGQAFLSDVQDGLPNSLTGQFQFTDTALNPPELYDAPLLIPEMLVDMRLNLAPFAVDIGQIYASLPGVVLRGDGRLAATDLGWDLALDMHIPTAEHADLMALWPASAVVPARKWFAEAFISAQYRDMQVSLRKTNAAPLQVAGSFGFADLGLQYMKTLPPIVDGAGTAVFTSDIFALALHAGQVTAVQGGTLDLAGSTMLIPDLKVRYRPASYDLVVDGDITAILSLLEQPPMGFMTKARLPVDVTAGTATVAMKLTHPMRRDMKADDISFSATAALRDVQSDGLIPERTLVARALNLAVDKQTLTLAGGATVDDVPINGTWTQTFGNGSAMQATVALNATHLQRFGVDLPPGSVAGAGQATLELRMPPGGAAPQYQVTSDLRGLQIAIPAVGWAKPPAVLGRLDIAGRLGPDPQVNRLSISGGGLEVRGDVSFNADGSLDRARLTQVALGDWLDAPITLRGRGPGAPLGVEINGGNIDLRRARFGRGTQSNGPIRIALDRLQVTEGIVLNRFVGDFTSTGGFAGQFDAWINNVGQIQGTVAPRNGRSAVRIVSDDAGGVALATGLMRTAVGGSLDLTLLPSGGDGTFDGKLAIRDLRIRDAPAVAALLDAISVVGLLQQLDGQGLSFDAVDAAFRLTPERVIVTESSAVGPGLGISLDGLYTLATKQMDFQGVISPFYLINSIGAIFTRRGEGLIGFNFNIAGTSTAPSVSVNPLSAFTPGMFREIFRRSPPVIGQ